MNKSGGVPVLSVTWQNTDSVESQKESFQMSTFFMIKAAQ